MTDAEVIRMALIEGAVGAAAIALIAFVLSRFVSDLAGRTLIVTVLFAGAGAYFGFAFNDQTSRIWVLIELLQVIAYGVLGLYALRGSPFWLALAWVLHPVWDFGVHYLGPGSSFAPLRYTIACISFDFVVAAYIVIAYRWLDLANRPALSRAR
jgi:hypothetical protein